MVDEVDTDLQSLQTYVDKVASASSIFGSSMSFGTFQVDSPYRFLSSQTDVDVVVMRHGPLQPIKILS